MLSHRMAIMHKKAIADVALAQYLLLFVALQHRGVGWGQLRSRWKTASAAHRLCHVLLCALCDLMRALAVSESVCDGFFLTALEARVDM